MSCDLIPHMCSSASAGHWDLELRLCLNGNCRVLQPEDQALLLPTCSEMSSFYWPSVR